MTIYDIEVQKPNGETYKLEEYKNKVLLIVNTASECGFTPQFEGLQHLYDNYKDRGFVVLGFPCNQFGVKNQVRVKKLLKTVKSTMAFLSHARKN